MRFSAIHRCLSVLRLRRICLLLLLAAAAGCVHAQPVTGVWRGKMIRGSGLRQVSSNIEVKLVKQGDSLYGTVYYYGGPKSYIRYSITGFLGNGDNVVNWRDHALVEVQPARPLNGPEYAEPMRTSADYSCPDGRNLLLEGSAELPGAATYKVQLRKVDKSLFPDEWDPVIDGYFEGMSRPEVIDSVWASASSAAAREAVLAERRAAMGDRPDTERSLAGGGNRRGNTGSRGRPGSDGSGSAAAAGRENTVAGALPNSGTAADPAAGLTAGNMRARPSETLPATGANRDTATERVSRPPVADVPENSTAAKTDTGNRQRSSELSSAGRSADRDSLQAIAARPANGAVPVPGKPSSEQPPVTAAQPPANINRPGTTGSDKPGAAAGSQDVSRNTQTVRDTARRSGDIASAPRNGSTATAANSPRPNTTPGQGHVPGATISGGRTQPATPPVRTETARSSGSGSMAAARPDTPSAVRPSGPPPSVTAGVPPATRPADGASSDLPVTVVSPNLQPVANPNPEIQQAYAVRKKLVQTEIPAIGDSIELRFYDNAEVDGDSISLFLNGRLLFQHVRLDVRPYIFRIALSDLPEESELAMVAENLGAIPPNTAYMEAVVEGRRYTARLESTENSTAVILLRRRR